MLGLVHGVIINGYHCYKCEHLLVKLTTSWNSFKLIATNKYGNFLYGEV